MHEIRNAFRALKAAPVVSAVAILSLALGIGANAAMFSILDSLLLHFADQRSSTTGDARPGQQRTHAAAIVLGAIGALAGWIPALRASRIDPARVSRDG